MAGAKRKDDDALKAAEAAETEANTKAAEAAETEANTKAAEAGYYVAPGKSITSRRGILGEGERVEPKDLSPDLKVGEEARKNLVGRGSVIKK